MKNFIFVVITLVVTTTLSWSQSAGDAIRVRQNEFGFGARNLAMGGNGVALATDYSSLYWNPAGLASMESSQLFGEFSYLNFANDAVFSGNLNSTDESFTRLRSFGLAVPLPTSRGSLVLALGYNFVKDYDEYLNFTGINQISNGLEFQLEDENGVSDWYAFDRNVMQTEEVTDEGGLHQWSLGAGIALSPNFDLGASLNFWRGRDDYSLTFKQVDDANVYNQYPGDFDSYSLNQNLLTDYKGASLKVGGMFRMNQNARLGMAVEFPTTLKVTENYASSDELIFDDGYVDAVDYEPGEWEYKVRLPYRFDAGLALRASRLTLNGAVTYQDWSQTRFETPDWATLDDDFSDLLNENQFLRQDYRETINYHLGAELAMPGNNLFLRGGYAVYPSPLKDATSEMDRKYYSGGIGFKAGRNVDLDMTYVRGSWTRQSEDSYTPGGTLEDITEGRVFMGLKYHF